MKYIVRLFISIILMLTLLTTISVSAATYTPTQVPYESYTYWEGFTGKTKKATYSKPMYSAKMQISANSLGIEKFGKIVDVCSDINGNVYFLDSTSSKIIVLDSNYKYLKTVGTINDNGTAVEYKGASGIFVSEEGRIYIADTENGRVLIADKDGNLIKNLGLPDSGLIPDNFVFRPTAIVVSSDNDVYVLSDGSFYGAVTYNRHYEFQGFYGSNSVKNSVLEGILNLWNNLFVSDAKRENSEKSLPYQFTDMCIDSKGFIYTTTGKTETESNDVGQIKKLSPSGVSILDGDDYNYVDEGYTNTSGDSVSTQIQDLLAIDVDDNGYIFALDSTYGRIFVYNSENRLMCAFGGGRKAGKGLGLFTMASSIDEHNGNILVSDSSNNNVTVFVPTEYGKDCFKANLMTRSGQYVESKELWQSIHDRDSNNQLAYVGLAKAYLAEDDYDTALEYAKFGYDRELYDQAFKQVRDDFINKNFSLLFIGLLLIIAGIIFLFVYTKKKNMKIIKNKQISFLFSIIRHPVQGFDEIKEKKFGSALIATILIVIYYIIAVLKSMYSGFSFSYFDSSTYNSLFVLLKSAGAVVLWTVCNWAVCTLFNGKGTIRNIYVSTAYCILPLIISDAVYLIASNLLTSSEGAFLSIFSVVMILITAFYFIIAMIRIHDFSFGKFALTSVISVFGMLLLVFFISLLILLIQQLAGFIVTFLDEVISVIGGLL